MNSPDLLPDNSDLKELLRRAQQQHQSQGDEPMDSATTKYVSSSPEPEPKGISASAETEPKEISTSAHPEIAAETQTKALEESQGLLEDILPYAPSTLSTATEEDEAGKPRKTSRNQEVDSLWLRFRNYPRHYWYFILWAVFCIGAAGAWSTYFNMRLRQVSSKEEVLKDLRYRMLYTTAELVRLERISSVEERIKDLGLPLEHSTQPPYQIVDTLLKQGQD